MTAGMTAGMNRRRALTGAAAAGVGVPLLAACAGDDRGSTATDTGGASESSDTPSESSSASSGGGGGGALTSTSDVPVGGGAVFNDEQVVVTQPADGDFKAFSSVCTHQGCQVLEVEDNQILCPCHGSAFSAEDGSVTTGPATSPLEAVEISIDGDEISLA